ncbi:uncharacterized protein [Prorops nasuta]|uniref:uncharacterized protein n=1 Tax=Prorops nasuta TaxID=863751 RepID=UPI0034CDAFEB
MIDFCAREIVAKVYSEVKMVWDDGLSVKELTEMKKKTPKFPSRERNFAMRRKGPRRTLSFLGDASPIGAPPIPEAALFPQDVEATSNVTVSLKKWASAARVEWPLGSASASWDSNRELPWRKKEAG